MPAQTAESALPLGDMLGAILSMPWQQEAKITCDGCGVEHQAITGSTGFTKNGNRRRKMKQSSEVVVMFHTFEDETFIIGAALPGSMYSRFNDTSHLRVMKLTGLRCEKQQAKKAIDAPETSIDDLIDQQAEVPDYA